MSVCGRPCLSYQIKEVLMRPDPHQRGTAVYNLFNLGRYLVSAAYYRKLRTDAFGQWTIAVA